MALKWFGNRAAAAAASLALLLLGTASGQIIPVSFNHGVASGDPLSTSIILWTRVTPRELNATVLASQKFPVKWLVSANPDLSVPAAGGELVTDASRDFTVKVEASGLKPGGSYFFVFLAGGGAIRSPVGRFRLPAAPGQPQKQLRYAIFSCSNWGWGYFNAYDAATRFDLDFWMHLGDFIYEYSVNEYPSPIQAVRFQQPPLGLQPRNELFSLSDYRQRHALYRQDPGLQALSASAPVISAWDDHEVANDAWMDGAENHQTNEGSYSRRKAAGVRAYHEWMPTRPKPSNPVAFFRSFQFGNLATLLMLETRLSARTNPVPGGSLNNAFGTLPQMGFAYPPNLWTQQMIDGAKAFAAEGDAVRNQANRTILGSQQLNWIRSTTRDSLAAGTTWQLYGQDTVMLDQYAPDLELAIKNERAGPRKQLWQSSLTNLTDASPNRTTSFYTKTPRWSYLRGLVVPVTDAMKYAIRAIMALGRYKVTWNFDNWMGYQAEKSRFLSAVTGGAADAGAASKLNAVVYGGDSHNAWVGVQQVNGTVVAAEFDGPGVTSPGFEDFFPYIPLDLLAAGMVLNNPGMSYANVEDKGFMLATLSHKAHRLDMLTVSTVGSMQYQLLCDASFTVAAGQKTVRRVKCPAVPQGTPYSSIALLNDGLGRYGSALA